MLDYQWMSIYQLVFAILFIVFLTPFTGKRHFREFWWHAISPLLIHEKVECTDFILVLWHCVTESEQIYTPKQAVSRCGHNFRSPCGRQICRNQETFLCGLSAGWAWPQEASSFRLTGMQPLGRVGWPLSEFIGNIVRCKNHFCEVHMKQNSRRVICGVHNVIQ